MSRELRELTFDASGKLAVAVCLFCHKNEVPIDSWNKRCDSCRAKQKQKDEIEQKQIAVGVGRRIPAAVIELENGTKVFVDKFGKEVDNPGYDFQGDPRGWKFTKTAPKERVMIK